MNIIGINNFLIKLLILIPLLHCNSVFAAEVKLNWVYESVILEKYSHGMRIQGKYYFTSKENASTKIFAANINRDKLSLKILFHNTTDEYLCYLVNTNKNSTLMDDEFGDEYKGAVLQKKSEQDNKLSPNQRKLVTLIIDAPNEDVSLVNLHLGLRYLKLASGSEKCNTDSTNEFDIHKLDWDISTLRE